MKNLVVYYTRSGNTEAVAQEISKMVDGELKKIELQSEISFGWAAFSSLLGLKGKIKTMNLDLKDYDNIFVGCQVWAGKTSTPINTFINKADFTNKDVYVFVTQADDKFPSAVFDSIKKRIEARNGKVVDSFYIQTDMKNPLKPEQATQPVSDWIIKNNLAKSI